LVVVELDGLSLELVLRDLLDVVNFHSLSLVMYSSLVRSMVVLFDIIGSEIVAVGMVLAKVCLFMLI
jgi:hypothetical protein